MYRKFCRYVALSTAGTLGFSLYVIVDTFFISVAAGTVGLTALNLFIPFYNIIFALAAMVGVGASIRYSVLKGSGDEAQADTYFTNAVFWGLLLSVPFVLIALTATPAVMTLLGAEGEILTAGVPYARLVLFFSPAFMLNHILGNFVRNDGDPSVVTAANLSGSFFNVVFDYLLIFPCGMGFKGAALATGLSPLVSMAVMSLHLQRGRNHLRFRGGPSVRRLLRACQVGFNAFVTEIAGGVITLSFNYLILGLAGNIGVAAYGVITNISAVVVSIFNGISVGAQPLISDSRGRGDQKAVRLFRRLTFGTDFAAAALIYGLIFVFAEPLAGLFNSQNSEALMAYAVPGLRLYFTGSLFASLNIAGGSYFSASEQAGPAFWISILRGFVLILAAVFLLSALFGLTGIWVSYGAAEAAALLVTAGFLVREKARKCS